jgi:hypothetical protein
VNVSISFRLRQTVKKVVGLVASVAPRGGGTKVTPKNRDCVQMMLHLVPVSANLNSCRRGVLYVSYFCAQVDPECAAKISNQRVDVLSALHYSTSEADFIVLFFVWIDKVKI